MHPLGMPCNISRYKNDSRSKIRPLKTKDNEFVKTNSTEIDEPNQ